MKESKTESVLLWLFFTIFVLMCLLPIALFMAREITSTPEILFKKQVYFLENINPKGTQEDFINWFQKDGGGFLYNNWAFWILTITSIVSIILLIVGTMQVWKMKATEIAKRKQAKYEADLETAKFLKQRSILKQEEKESAKNDD